jgi:phosphoribosylglycinamide formyltransferase-1
MKQIAIFSSGTGSNAKKIIDHLLFLKEKSISTPDVSLLVCNKPEAGVLKIAAENNIPALLIEKEKFFRGNAYTDELKAAGIDFIILAGFLWKVPATLIKAFHGKMINIHPALLPKYGGKGMYGNFVHEAVIVNKEKESGITIHYVDEVYDHGQIILQQPAWFLMMIRLKHWQKKCRCLNTGIFPLPFHYSLHFRLLFAFSFVTCHA